jgi:hypothetical protein
MALGRQLFDGVDQVRTKPWLPRVTLALVGEAPLLDASPLRDQLRGTQQLILVGITLLEDARRKTVGREDGDDLLGPSELSTKSRLIGDAEPLGVALPGARTSAAATFRR